MGPIHRGWWREQLAISERGTRAWETGSTVGRDASQVFDIARLRHLQHKQVPWVLKSRIREPFLSQARHDHEEHHTKNKSALPNVVFLESFDALVAYRSCTSSGDKNRSGVTSEAKTHSSIGWWCQLEYTSEDGSFRHVPVTAYRYVRNWALARAADVSSASGNIIDAIGCIPIIP